VVEEAVAAVEEVEIEMKDDSDVDLGCTLSEATDEKAIGVEPCWEGSLVETSW